MASGPPLVPWARASGRSTMNPWARRSCAYPVMPTRLSPRPWRRRTASPLSWQDGWSKREGWRRRACVMEASERSASGRGRVDDFVDFFGQRTAGGMERAVGEIDAADGAEGQVEEQERGAVTGAAGNGHVSEGLYGESGGVVPEIGESLNHRGHGGDEEDNFYCHFCCWRPRVICCEGRSLGRMRPALTSISLCGMIDYRNYPSGSWRGRAQSWRRNNSYGR